MASAAYSNAPRRDMMRNPGTVTFDDDETSCRSDATSVAISNRLPRSPRGGKRLEKQREIKSWVVSFRYKRMQGYIMILYEILLWFSQYSLFELFYSRLSKMNDRGGIGSTRGFIAVENNGTRISHHVTAGCVTICRRCHHRSDKQWQTVHDF